MTVIQKDEAECPSSQLMRSKEKIQTSLYFHNKIKYPMVILYLLYLNMDYFIFRYFTQNIICFYSIFFNIVFLISL